MNIIRSEFLKQNVEDYIEVKRSRNKSNLQDIAFTLVNYSKQNEIDLNNVIFSKYIFNRDSQPNYYTTISVFKNTNF